MIAPLRSRLITPGLAGDVATDVVFLFDQFNEQMTFRSG